MSFFTGMLLFACNNDKPDADAAFTNITTNVTFSSFSVKNDIPIKKMGPQLGDVLDMQVMDSFLIVSTLRDSAVLQIIHIPSGTVAGHLISRGKGDNECLNIATILPTSDKNICWCYDITLGKFLKINVPKALSAAAYIPEKTFMLTPATKGAKSPSWINDSTFAACSYFMNDCRYFYFNSQDSGIRKAGQLPSPGKGWPDENPKGKFSLLATAYSANMKKHPTDDLFAVAYNVTGRMELYEGGKLKRLIKGPESFQPIYTFKYDGESNIPVQNSKTLFSNVQLKVTEKHIYLLYSGRNEFQTCGQKILVFDWQGNPLSMVNLNADYCSFTVEEKGNQSLIYLINKDTGELVSTSI
ncbi:TolB-like protein [Chitinophaga niastensis]|uniref:TolB-like protein n=2 Tax=Chitinophaga niastensis TaxID=536980 RepID=A0A2P8HJZ5_CHINA|nr:TolB-like protein [Chitinophaga niastensis]